MVTRRGKPAALIMSMDEYEGLMETLDIMSEPGAVEEIRQAHQDYLDGKAIPFEEVEAALRAKSGE